MLNNSIRILNFDNSALNQKKLLSNYKGEIIDFRDIALNSRLWLNKKYENIINLRLEKTSKNSITFLGSGDFHHISAHLLKKFKDPITLIVFDYHPDWDIMPPRLGCGSWVSEALRMDNVDKVILLGISSKDISTICIQTGNLNSLKNNRLEIYPYEHAPSRTFFRKVPDNVSFRLERGIISTKIYWKGFKNLNIEDFFYSLLKRIKVKEVYLSIDKDCLKSGYALTNWEEGLLELKELLKLTDLINKNLNIVGMDITGEYSAPKFSPILKDVLSRLDHPKDFSAKGKDAVSIDSINENTNLKLLEVLIK